MTHPPRLRLTLPPVSSQEAVTLSYLCRWIDDLLWIHYGDEMLELLHHGTFVAGTWWSTRRRAPVVDSSRSGSVDTLLGRIPRNAPRTLPHLLRDKRVERGDVKKRGR